MQTINAQQLGISITQNSSVPDEGPKIVPLDLDFTTNDSYFLDTELIQSQARLISMLQSIYVDLATSTVDLTMVVEGTRQRFIFKAGTQGYYTVLAPNPLRITFTCAGGPALRVHLINVAIAGATWN